MESYDRFVMCFGVIIVFCYKFFDFVWILFKFVIMGQCQVGCKFYCLFCCVVGFVWVWYYEVCFYVEVVEVVFWLFGLVLGDGDGCGYV